MDETIMKLSREGQYLQNQIAGIMQSFDNLLNSANNRFRELNAKLDAANDRIRQHEEHERIMNSLFRFRVYYDGKVYYFENPQTAYKMVVQYGGMVEYHSKHFGTILRRHIIYPSDKDGLFTGEDVITEHYSILS